MCLGGFWIWDSWIWNPVFFVFHVDYDFMNSVFRISDFLISGFGVPGLLDFEFQNFWIVDDWAV